MKYATQTTLVGIIYVRSFIQISSEIQKLLGHTTTHRMHTHTHTTTGSLKPTFIFQNNKSKLKIRHITTSDMFISLTTVYFTFLRSTIHWLFARNEEHSIKGSYCDYTDALNTKWMFQSMLIYNLVLLHMLYFRPYFFNKYLKFKYEPIYAAIRIPHYREIELLLQGCYEN
jgi:hypothetical protein